jgi:hypothetical protein
VHEHVLAALLRDEPEPLRIIEPLHLSCGHLLPSFQGPSAPWMLPPSTGSACARRRDKQKRRANWISRGVKLDLRRTLLSA